MQISNLGAFEQEVQDLKQRSLRTQKPYQTFVKSHPGVGARGPGGNAVGAQHFKNHSCDSSLAGQKIILNIIILINITISLLIIRLMHMHICITHNAYNYALMHIIMH